MKAKLNKANQKGLDKAVTFLQKAQKNRQLHQAYVCGVRSPLGTYEKNDIN
jgi:hypothetical protein